MTLSFLDYVVKKMEFSEDDGMWYMYSVARQPWDYISTFCRDKRYGSRLAVLKSAVQIQKVLNYYDRLGKLQLFYMNMVFWGPPSLSKLTPMIFNTGFPHLCSENSISNHIIGYLKCYQGYNPN